MVGVKRPARDSDRPSTKKLKFQNGAKGRLLQAGTFSSKDVPVRSTIPDKASEYEPNESNSSAEEDNRSSEKASGAARSTEPLPKLQTDDNGENGVLNGKPPL